MEIIALFTERPYVVAFFATFVVVAWAERGWQRMLIWFTTGTFIGWLAEFSSTHNGFPFGHYTYREANFPDELWIGGVPLFASISFAFLTYFGYSAACTLLSRLERRGKDVQRVVDARIDGSIRVLLLAAAMTTWVDTVIDPVTHLGRYWFLGDLYIYETAGQHFDVPLTNYAGWFLVSASIVLVNQVADGVLQAGGIAPNGFHLPYKPFWALSTLLADFVFMLGVTVYLFFADGVPDSEPIAQILLSGLLLSAAFVAFMVFMLRRSLAGDRPAVSQSSYA